MTSEIVYYASQSNAEELSEAPFAILPILDEALVIGVPPAILHKYIAA